MILGPKTIFCYECRKAFRTAKGCQSHGAAKKHQWQTPAGAVISISVPTAPSGLAAELSSQVVTLAAHVQGEGITSQCLYCPMCSRRWGTWFELNRHYVQAHPALEDILRSQCASPRPLVIEDEDERPAESLRVEMSEVQQTPEVNIQSPGPVVAPVGIETTLAGEAASIAVLEYPAAELVEQCHDASSHNDSAPQPPTDSTVSAAAAAVSDVKKAIKAEKAAKKPKDAATEAEKKAAKAATKAERKAKKAAAKAAREESSRVAGIDNIDVIKVQIANLQKTHESLSRETSKIVDRLTAFHDGVLSLQHSGENVAADGFSAATEASGAVVPQRTEGVSVQLTDEQLLHIFALRHGIDVSLRVRELLVSKDTAATHSEGSQCRDTGDVPSPTTSLPKSLSDSWEKTMFDELRGTSNSSADAQVSHTTRNPAPLRCRLCKKDVCDEPVATPCGHVFCHGCIGRQLITRTKCPVCQRTVLQRLALE